MANLKKRGNYKTVQEAVEGNTGICADDLINPAREDPRAIHNMYNAAVAVIKAMESKATITIIGDYDSDGLNATAILVKMFRHYGVEPGTIIPRRISDGYGLSKNLLDSIKPGLVITIDNGIRSVEEISILKQKGCYVIVLDHHMPGDMLPDADILVDPHVNPKKNGFEHYCGAGLGYQLARLIMEQDKSPQTQTLLDEMNVHAAIATITDVVPLQGANRRIVMDGLQIAKYHAETLSPGLRLILSTAGEGEINEDSIGFTVGPIINAPARLYDAGGESTLKALLCTDYEAAGVFVNAMVDINTSRRGMVKNIKARADSIIAEQGLMNQAPPMMVYLPNCAEGVMGIIAGKLSEEYHMPAFVLTDSKNEPGVLKGSGRAGAHYNLAPVADAIAPMCIQCGGHQGAMGLTIAADRFQEIQDEMRKALVTQSRENVEDNILVDLVLRENEVVQVYREMKQFAPYGEGNRKPVILVHGFQAVFNDYKEYFRIMGSDGKTVKICGRDFDCIGFSLAEKYAALGYPPKINIVGTLGSNTFRGKTTIQFEMLDLAVCKD